MEYIPPSEYPNLSEEELKSRRSSLYALKRKTQWRSAAYRAALQIEWITAELKSRK